MLRGNYPATVDGKGRVKVPTTFKSQLEVTFGHDFYVTSLDGQSVRVYPFSVWRGIEEKLATLPSMNKAKRKFLDRVNYWGQSVQMDAQGRILIPSLLRESAGMQGEVAVIGYLNYLDVWNMDRFRAQLKDNPLTDEDMQALSDLGI
ncbi:MAG TPA: division/cell wall cluster transcriptional repressor MraZ [Terriglobia bacterium]|nr:division/cell wall cluster transcriptional repressor MraZ [Terriglobia bacterium]HKT11084.1 division/cell wall cluster transcriptional repressor MraZ [Terriglobia bacterium]